MFIESTKNSELSNTRESIKLHEEFDDFLNVQSLWSYDIYIPQEPVRIKNYELTIFRKSEKTFTMFLI